MKYHYEKPNVSVPMYGETIVLADHPAYYAATLFHEGDRGVAVTQLHFYENSSKSAVWSAVDPVLANDIYLSPNFKKFFEEHARKAPYPIYQLRSIMWQLRMKPLEREDWEVYF